jgi:hypothetical protein
VQWKSIVDGRTGTQVLYEGPVPSSLEELRDSTMHVTSYMCGVRHFCGRFGRAPLSPFTVIGRAVKSRIAAESGPAKLLYIREPDSRAQDIVAHEFGHLMDFTYAAGVRGHR